MNANRHATYHGWLTKWLPSVLRTFWRDSSCVRIEELWSREQSIMIILVLICGKQLSDHRYFTTKLPRKVHRGNPQQGSLILNFSLRETFTNFFCRPFSQNKYLKFSQSSLNLTFGYEDPPAETYRQVVQVSWVSWHIWEFSDFLPLRGSYHNKIKPPQHNLIQLEPFK